MSQLVCNRNIARRGSLCAVLELLAALTFGPQPTHAAVTEAWVHRYSNLLSNANDHATKVVRDAAGDVIVSDFTDDGITGPDMLTIKYSGTDGSVLWQKRYNSPWNGDDGAVALVLDASGNVMVVTGEAYMAKYAAADGALLWEKLGSNGGARAATVDGSGNVVVTGYSYNTNFSSDYYTAKYAAANGALLWERRYNGPGNGDDVAAALAVDASGNVVVTGRSYNGSDYDRYMARYAAADGALLWEKRYNAPFNDTPFIKEAVALDGSGNVVVTGSFAGDYYLAKYAASDGTLLWEKQTHDGGQGLALDGSGNVVVIGSNYDQADTYYTAKYAAADGALLWEKRYKGSANGDHYASSLALGSNGMVAVTGSSGGDYATVVYRETLPPVSVALVPTGLRLGFTGVPCRSYAIERAPAVTGPWTTIDAQTAPASGLLEYLDEPPSAAVFYRTSAP